MTVAELLARISSRELTEWSELFRLHNEESEHARDVAESEDGIVHVTGLEDRYRGGDDDDEDDPFPDEPEPEGE